MPAESRSPIRPQIKRDNRLVSLRSKSLSNWTNNERHSFFAFVYLAWQILFYMIDSYGLAMSSYNVSSLALQILSLIQC